MRTDSGTEEDNILTEKLQEFIFTDKVSVFMTCQINSCKKKMPYAIRLITVLTAILTGRQSVKNL